jgi:isocitrate dehydrogenase
VPADPRRSTCSSSSRRTTCGGTPSASSSPWPPHFEHLAHAADNAGAQILANALDRATATFLENAKSPSRKVGELDNRGSHFYLALYWAQELAEQTDDEALQQVFAPLARRLAEEEQTIIDELNAVQGEPVDIGGYFHPDLDIVTQVMRPSETFNTVLAELGAR